LHCLIVKKSMMRFKPHLVFMAWLVTCFQPMAVESQDLFFQEMEVDFAYQDQLLEWQEIIADTDNNYWEWVVIRVNGAKGLENADEFTAADAVVEFEALNGRTPDVEFYKNATLTRFSFDEQTDNSDPEW
jgi:hypothetical protein